MRACVFAKSSDSLLSCKLVEFSSETGRGGGRSSHQPNLERSSGNQFQRPPTVWSVLDVYENDDMRLFEVARARFSVRKSNELTLKTVVDALRLNRYLCDKPVSVVMIYPQMDPVVCRIARFVRRLVFVDNSAQQQALPHDMPQSQVERVI